jgi:hypothetical protein
MRIPTWKEVEQLYERYARHLEATHWGRYLSLAWDGRYIVGEDDVTVMEEGLRQFGQGKFMLLRVGDLAVDTLRRVFAGATPHRPLPRHL